jgi:hypothetical protein
MPLTPITARRCHCPHAAVDGTELKLKLGFNAFEVWRALMYCSDDEGISHATVDGLARLRGFKSRSRGAVKYGLDRLRSAGLVKDVGLVVRMLPKRGRLQPVRVYERIVLGVEKLNLTDMVGGGEGFFYEVPLPTLEWMKTASTHGGRREGAGSGGTRKGAGPKSLGGGLVRRRWRRRYR